jgi:hypothetical protein
MEEKAAAVRAALADMRCVCEAELNKNVYVVRKQNENQARLIKG